MALLSQMIRHVAITGRSDDVNAWFATRQGGRWAEQTVRAAFPPAPPRAQSTRPDETLRQLTELHRRGVVTDAEFETLSAGLRA